MSDNSNLSYQEETASTSSANNMETPADDSNEPVYLNYIINAMVSVAVGGILLLLYHYFIVVNNQPKFAVLDVAELVEIKQAQVSQNLIRPGASDSDRGNAYEEIKVFSTSLQTTIKDLQAECDCTILVKAAVVRTDYQDLTHVAKERLGLDGVNMKAIIENLQGNNSLQDQLPAEKRSQ